MWIITIPVQILVPSLKGLCGYLGRNERVETDGAVTGDVAFRREDARWFRSKRKAEEVALGVALANKDIFGSLSVEPYDDPTRTPPTTRLERKMRKVATVGRLGRRVRVRR